MMFRECNFLRCFSYALLFCTGVKEVATLQNIDDYMMNLHSIINSNQDAALLQTVRDVVGRLEFNG